MMQDLIERYIYAVVRRMPRKQQEDVSQELRGLIDDMLLERCGQRKPEEKDVRVVLTELGGPQELYEKYDGDSGKCLIGQPYYTTYKYVLKIVLLSVAAGMIIASSILQLTQPQDILGEVLRWIGNLYNGLLSAFAIVTLLFAFFYKKNVPLTQPFNFDDLPPVPKKNETIPKWECYAGIGISVAFLAVFLTVPQIFFVIMADHGGIIPIFSTEAVRGTWYILLLFTLCGITREIVQLMEGRYNRRVLAVKLVTNGLSALLTIWWLTGFDLMAPEFVSAIGQLFAGGPEMVIWIFSHFQVFFQGCILVALLLDTAECWYKCRKE